MTRSLAVVLLVLVLGGCGGEPTSAPDLVATQVAVQRAAGATVTAEAVLTLDRQADTPVPISTLAPTATRTEAPQPTLAATASPMRTATDTVLPPGPSETPVRQPTASPTAFQERAELYCVVDVASDDVLNVRTQAGVAHPIVGSISPYGMDVHVGISGEEVAGSLWVPVVYRDVAGWANSLYLARQAGRVDAAARARAVEIVMALKHKDLERLAPLVHPEKGVRFSPYAYVRVGPAAPGDEDLVFDATEIRDLGADPTVYLWGWFDGSGEPIELTFWEYYERFIYDADFARPHVVGLDETVGSGNSINNIAEVYPEAVTVEHHFEGFDPQYSGMDWRSLRMVLEQYEGAWYLVGLVHDEWTI